MSDSVSVLLFDLGGVLVDFSGHEELQALLPGPMPVEELTAAWHACPHSLAYGVGTLTTAEFIPRFRRDWGIALEDGPFLDAWQSWVRGWLPGARELLDRLRPRFRLAALSNSNAAHWERLAALGVLDAFEVALGSQQLGVRKPDPATFAMAVNRLEVAPEAILFFDDSRANVEAAIAAGLQGAHVQGPDDVARHLAGIGLL